MTDNWAIEVRDTSGKSLLVRPVASAAEIKGTLAAVLTYGKTGGIVIYRSTVATGNDCGTDEERPGGIFGTDSQEIPTDVASSNDCTCTGPPINELDPNCPKHKFHCHTCGCPPDNMPMVNRGTGWCCEKHRKEQL